jgi:hypothetical protein
VQVGQNVETRMQTRAGGLIGKICWGGFVLLHQLAEEAETGGRYFPFLSRIAVGARAETQEDRVLDKLKDAILFLYVVF